MLAEARNGGGGSLVLRGELGIGKTALAAFAIAAASGFLVVRSTGLELELGLPYAGLHQLLGPLLRDLELLPAPQRHALQAAFGKDGDSPQRFFVALGVLTLLANAAEERPVLCVVDDAQWIDAPSIETLVVVARRLQAERIALLFALREPAEPRVPLDGLRKLTIGGLPRDAARELIAAEVPGELDGGVRDLMVAAAGGNPLGLIELAAALTPGQLAGYSPLPQPLPVAPPVEQSFVMRVASLPAETQSLLRLVAAEGTGDADLVWRAARRLGVARTAAAPAEQEGLLAAGPGLAFRHPLIAQAILHSTPPTALTEVHRALAQVLDKERDPDRRAWHRASAAPGRSEAIAAELVRCAARAGQRGGRAATAAFLERAAELTPDPKRRAVRLVAAAEAAFAAGGAEKASALVAAAGADLVDPRGRAQAKRLAGTIALVHRADSQAAQLLLEAAAELGPLDRRASRGTLLAGLMAVTYQGRFAPVGSVEAAARLARDAPRVPRSKTTSADRLLEGFAALYLDDPVAAVPPLREALERLRHESDLPLLAIGCLAAVELRDDESLFTLATRRVQLARATGSLTALPHALAYLGTVYEVLVGRLDVAAARLAEAAERTQAAGVWADGRRRLGHLLIASWRGSAEARGVAENAARDAAARGQGVEIALVGYALSVLELGLGNYRPALAAALDATGDDVPLATVLALPGLIEAAAYDGRAELAAAAVERIAAGAVASGTEWALGTLARSRALVAKRDEADDLFRQSIDHLRRCRVTPQLARTRLLYGEWLRRERRHTDAREQLRAAHQTFSAMGAAGFAERAHLELFATGERPRRRSAEAIELLTPQEARISRLVSEGASNSEIASSLFISPRTVEYHLHKVFRKLGISSRTQLARSLFEHGGPTGPVGPHP